jgi:aspartokinase-like uncharacterized kinase
MTGRRPPPARPAFDLLVKIGGSLGRDRALPRLLRRLAGMARRRRLLAVPGGGRFADLVRRERSRLAIPEAAAHRMALLAMDQYALLLAALCPGARRVETLAAARRVARAGRLPILLCSGIVERAPRLERSFRLTSDSIAAWLAGRAGARRLLLLKSVRRPDGAVRSRGALRALARHGLVDPLFPAMVPDGVEVIVLNGRRPGDLERRLSEACRRAAGRRRAGRA